MKKFGSKMYYFIKNISLGKGSLIIIIILVWVVKISKNITINQRVPYKRANTVSKKKVKAFFNEKKKNNCEIVLF